jgi:hypothetical protein
MTITSLKYFDPIRRSEPRSAVDYALLEEAIELAREQNHIASIERVFAHVFPGHAIDLHAGFTFTQGSAQVHCKVAEGALAISAPLARLVEGSNAIAALRYVLTRVSGSGQMHQPRLRNNDLSIEFREPIGIIQPTKLLEVVKRIATEAEASENWILTQFGAARLSQATVAALEPAVCADAIAIWRAHWADIDALVKESQRKRSMFFLNEVTAFALNRITYTLPLHGFVAARLSERGTVFNDSSVDPSRREETLRRAAKEMRDLSDETLRACLGHATHAIDPLEPGLTQVIASNLGASDYMKNIDRFRTSEKASDAALALFGTYYFLLSRYSWPDHLAEELTSGLKQASGQGWRAAAKTLFDHAKELATRLSKDLDESEDENGPRSVEERK